MKKNNKGFTLAELLIVVAIIAVLVAVSIPMFAGQLAKARTSTNQANIRAAEAAAVADYLMRGDTDGAKYEYTVSTSTLGTAQDLGASESGDIKSTSDTTNIDSKAGTKTFTKITVFIDKDGGVTFDGVTT